MSLQLLRLFGIHLTVLVRVIAAVQSNAPRVVFRLPAWVLFFDLNLYLDVFGFDFDFVIVVDFDRRIIGLRFSLGLAGSDSLLVRFVEISTEFLRVRFRSCFSSTPIVKSSSDFLMTTL